MSVTSQAIVRLANNEDLEIGNLENLLYEVQTGKRLKLKREMSIKLSAIVRALSA